jgi:hypothetical protein
MIWYVWVYKIVYVVLNVQPLQILPYGLHLHLICATVTDLEASFQAAKRQSRPCLQRSCSFYSWQVQKEISKYMVYTLYIPGIWHVHTFFYGI